MSTAYAYFRLAAKADRARNYRQGSFYRETAYRLVERDRRQREAAATRRAK